MTVRILYLAVRARFSSKRPSCVHIWKLRDGDKGRAVPLVGRRFWHSSPRMGCGVQ